MASQKARKAVVNPQNPSLDITELLDDARECAYTSKEVHWVVYRVVEGRDHLVVTDRLLDSDSAIIRADPEGEELVMPVEQFE